MQQPKPKKKNIDFSRKKMVDTSLIVALGAVIILIGTYVPFLGFLGVFSALPVIIASYRNGVSYGLMASFTLTVILSLFTHPINAVTLLLIFFIPGVCMGFFISEKRGPFDSIFSAFVAMVFTGVASLQVFSYFIGIDVISFFTTNFTEAVNLQYDILKDVPNVQLVDPKVLISTATMLIPSFIIGGAMVLSFLNYYMSAVVIRRLGEKRKLGSLLEFSLPGNVSFGILIIYLLTLISGYMDFAYYESLAANITVIFILLFFLQGLAVIAYFLQNLKLSKPVKTIIVAVLVLLAPVSSFFAIIGIADTIFNFRRLKR